MHGRVKKRSLTMPVRFLALVLSLLSAPCASPEAHETSAPSGGESAVLPAPHASAESAAVEPHRGDDSDEGDEVEEIAEPTPAPPEEAALRVRELQLHSPIGEREIAAMAAIADGHERRENVFSKMGGSSAVSRAFLHCFASDEFTNLAEHEHLRETLLFFREGRAGRGSPFLRNSVGTRVGWSVRHLLTGRPHRGLLEVRETQARYALVLFGGNDVGGRQPLVYGERLEQLFGDLSERGVIPILGAAFPRGDRNIDPMVRRYNRVARTLARAWGIPYVDFYTASYDSPNHGLARDGVHPNVFIDGRRGRGCELSAPALRHGQNQRNLRTLEALDRVRRARTEGALDETPSPRGDGSPADPFRVVELPFGDHFEVNGDAPNSALDGYVCAGESAATPERVYRLEVDSPTEIWAAAVGRRVEATLRLMSEAPNPAQCSHAGQRIEAELQPGVHFLVVEYQGGARAGSASVLIDAQRL